jgi:hypothetical protein
MPKAAASIVGYRRAVLGRVMLSGVIGTKLLARVCYRRRESLHPEQGGAIEEGLHNLAIRIFAGL